MEKNGLKRAVALIMVLLIVLSVPAIASADGNSITTKRVAGTDRYGTAFAAADAIREVNGKYPNIVIASGANFPDALAGGYLAYVMDAPLLLTNPSQESRIISYIQNYIEPGGTVYMLGGNFAVREAFEDKLAALIMNGADFEIERVYGANRYTTNLDILDHAIRHARTKTINPPKRLLIASGKSFADSLSASAVCEPLLLVGDTLDQTQLDWLKTCGINDFEIIGGEAAVSKSVENELRKIGTVGRVFGQNRWETSLSVANYFFPGAKAVTLASGLNFPDGLSGAPVAMLYNSPIVLVSNSAYSHAEEFVKNHDINGAIIMGGTAAISDATVSKIVSAASTITLNPTNPTDTGETTDTPTRDNTSTVTTPSGGKYPIPAADASGRAYVLNINSGKFHYPTCRSLPEGENRYDITTTREKIIAAGYDSCGICKP